MPVLLQTVVLGPLEIVGLAAIVGACLAGIALAWATVWALAGADGRAVPLPGFTLALMEFFGPLSRAIFRNADRLDRACIALHNQLSYPAYCAVPLERRVVILPQCLRNADCPARVSSAEGILCKECGKCVVCRIREIDRRIAVFISPGGTFSRRLLKSQGPGAVLGVACANDLAQGLRAAARARIPAQGVALSRTGCVATEVDFEPLKKLLLAVS